MVVRLIRGRPGGVLVLDFRCTRKWLFDDRVYPFLVISETTTTCVLRREHFAVFLFLIFFLWFELKLILLQCNSCSSLCSFVLGTRYDRPTWSNVELALKPNHFELTLGACIGPALANSAPHTGCNPIHPRTLLVFSGKPGNVEPESPVIRYVPYQSDRK